MNDCKPVDLRRLLRPHCEQPRNRRANQAANKFATPHVGPRQINRCAKPECRPERYGSHQMNDPLGTKVRMRLLHMIAMRLEQFAIGDVR